MSEVKGSSQYRSIVVRYRPWQRSVLIIVLLLIVLSVAGLSVWLARSDFAELEKQLLEENHTLKMDLLRVEKQRDEAEQQLANIRMGSDVDRVAVDDVRVQIKTNQDKIAGLTEEISFYKGLMSPSERERGLSVRNLELQATNTDNLYHYKLVLQQTALKHQLLKGTVRLVLIGNATDESGEVVVRRYALADLSEEVKVVDIPLRFKYFQNIEGELLLPDGFDVQKIELVARAVSPKKVQIEKTYEWQVRPL